MRCYTHKLTITKDVGVVCVECGDTMLALQLNKLLDRAAAPNVAAI